MNTGHSNGDGGPVKFNAVAFAVKFDAVGFATAEAEAAARLPSTATIFDRRRRDALFTPTGAEKDYAGQRKKSLLLYLVCISRGAPLSADVRAVRCGCRCVMAMPCPGPAAARPSPHAADAVSCARYSVRLSGTSVRVSETHSKSRRLGSQSVPVGTRRATARRGVAPLALSGSGSGPVGGAVFARDPLCRGARVVDGAARCGAARVVARTLSFRSVYLTLSAIGHSAYLRIAGCVWSRGCRRTAVGSGSAGVRAVWPICLM